MVIMKNVKKQQKITKIFRKGLSVPKLPKETEDFDAVQEEISKLEQQLKEKQDELFQLQRNSYRRKASPPAKNQPELFIRPQKIMLTNSVDSLKRELELVSMLSSMEVQSYVANDHCTIVYHMQHDSKNEIKHGLRIETKSGVNEVSKFSLPLGFNFDAVMEDFNNIMMPDCLGAIRKALVAYYDRLGQYEALKKLLNVEAELFKKIDGSHIEITFLAKSGQEEDDEPINVVLMLDYRVYDVRPKTFTFREIDLPEGAVEALREQCMVFKRKPLRKAFKEAFVDGIGPYKLVHQVGVRPPPQRRAHKRSRPHTQRYNNNDDTFRPEECSDEDDDDK
ncbi:uncharacterized protein ACR2FA_005791 [Aphomia sociella]